MELLDTLFVVEPIVQAFKRLGISYYIGGSVTSSIHGIPVQASLPRCRNR